MYSKKDKLNSTLVDINWFGSNQQNFINKFYVFLSATLPKEQSASVRQPAGGIEASPCAAVSRKTTKWDNMASTLLADN